ncbi:MAG TPA: RHS repeat-associated core domain-containing protein [Herpetosiphonaceae bacterium]
MYHRRLPLRSTLIHLFVCCALLLQSIAWPAPTTATTLATPENRPPVANGGGPYTVAEGGSVLLDAAASTDPDGDPLTITWDLDDDGTDETVGQTATFSAANLDGPRTVPVYLQVCDPHDACSTDVVEVRIANAAPTIGAVSAPLDPIAVGSVVTATATFTDVGVLDTHTSRWQWGDGTISGGTTTEADGAGTVTATHRYTTPGVYTLNVDLFDDDCGLTQAPFQYVVAYDPHGGFVTGGGWFASPSGAYPADPVLTGRANLGFNAKYQALSTTPTGQTEFQFQAGNLQFRSTRYDWLVVVGGQAQYRGTGTIGGATYSFLLTVVDGNSVVGGAADSVRMKIWDPARNIVVYDTQPGASDAATPTTTLGGGSITIRTLGKVLPPTPVPTPSATATPLPDCVPSATPTPAPTRTPVPTNTPTPTTTPTPTATATPTATETTPPTPTPTATPPGPGLPPDPATIAPPSDRTVSSDLASDTAFLYTGSNPIQVGVAPGTIDPQRVAVLRGRVTDAAGDPLPGVAIAVLDHPEFGTTHTRADGMFDLAVNGGGLLTLTYSRDGYLPLQRQLTPPWRDYAWLPEVTLLALDPVVTAVELDGSSEALLAAGSEVTDADGTRQATLLFPSDVTATLQLADGSTAPLSTLHLRITEYTVGERGISAMPGVLPPSSGYTYAAEFSVDEALASGATVTFSQPLINYVENFVGFPVGGIVPTGYYDRTKAAWIASDNGRIIKLVSITDGLADLDITGDGVVDDATSLGVTTEERQQLASRYAAGQELWRVLIPHFTPWDHNWPYGPPNDAISPNGGPPEHETLEDNPCERSGSIIECQNQTLGEEIAVSGTPLHLRYQSDRVPGRTAPNELEIPLSGANVPGSLREIRLEVSVAGRQFTQTVAAAADQRQTFTWDGRDAYGRRLQGSQDATIRIGFVYDAVYQEPATFAQSFGRFGSGTTITGDRSLSKVVNWQEYEAPIGAFDAQGQSLGGWTIDLQHTYDPAGQTLYPGSGGRHSAQDVGSIVVTTAGGGYGVPGDGLRAVTAPLDRPQDVVLGSDGSLYIADTFNHRIRRVGPDGIISTIAGTGESGFSGDGGPATAAELDYPVALALAADGTLYIADSDNHRIRKIAPNGIISTVAGGGSMLGDGGPATSAQLRRPDDVILAADGTLYIADTGHGRVRKVSPDGIITTVVGTGTAGFSGDGGPATSAKLSSPAGLALAADGSLLIADTGNNRIRKVSPDGIISTVAGTGVYGSSGDGGPATSANLSWPTDVLVDADGRLYIVEEDHIRRVSRDGTIMTVAGPRGLRSIWGDGYPALVTSMNPVSMALATDGSLYFADDDQYSIRKIAPDGIVSTVAGTGWGGYESVGDGIAATLARVSDPDDIALGPDGSLYIATRGENLIQRVGRDGIITTVAGIGSPGFSGDGGLATNAQLSAPEGIAVSPDGSVFIADMGNNRIRKVSPDGIITTVAGTGAAGFSGDGGPATNAQFSRVTDITLGPDGSLYIADQDNYRIRKVSPDGIITTVAGTGVWGFSGDGGLATNARLAYPEGVVLAPDGSLYIADTYNHRIRKVGPNGIITTMAGTAAAGFSGDGGAATTARLNSPTDVVVARDGSVYVSDQGNRRVRRIGPTGMIGTVAGGGEWGDRADGRLATKTYLYPQGLVLDADHTLYLGDGDRVRRVQSVLPGFSGGDLAVPSADGRELYQFSATGRHLRTRDALTGDILSTFGYDAAGRLITITDRAGLQTRIERIATGAPQAIVGPYGHRTTLTLDASGRLTRLTNPANEATEFTYTDDGLLTSLTDPRGGLHRFSYDAQGRLIRDANPVGGVTTLTRTGTAQSYTVTVKNALDDATRYTVEQVPNGDRRRTTIAPNGAVTTTLIKLDGTEIITAPDGTITTRVLSPDPRWGMQAPYIASLTTKTTDGTPFLTITASRSVTLGDPRNPLSLLTQTDTMTVNGRKTTTAYDAAARTLTTTTPAGEQTRIVLNLQSQPVRQQTTNLATTLFDYDAQGRLIRTSEGTGVVTRTETLAYRPQGDLASLTDPLGNTTSFTYDAVGRLTSEVLPTGQTLSYSYDASGNLVSSTDAQGVRTTYAYDAQNRRTSRTLDSEGRAVRTTYTYDTADNLTQMVEDAGSGRLNVTTRYAYTPIDAQGYAVSALTDSLGGVTRTTYTSFGEPSTITDPLNRTTTISYTAQGWIGSVTTPGGLRATTSYTTDGLPARVTDPRGSATVMTYDTAGRLATLTTGAAAIGTLPALNLKTTYTYDVNSRVTSVTDPRGTVTRYSYDAFDRPISSTDPLGTVTSFGYDLKDQMTSVVQAANVPSEALAVAYTYDAVGRLLTQRVDPDGQNLLTQYRYTRPGSSDTWNLQQVIDPRGNTTAYRYNPLGLRDQTTDALGSTWTVSYDNLGRATGQTDPLGQSITTSYDALDRIIAETEDGRTQQWSYHGDSTLASFTDFLDRITRYSYDLDRRLTGVDYPTGTADPSYAYDAASNVTRMTDGLGTTEYTYDVANRLISRARGGRTVGYAYNPNNQITAINYWGQGEVRYGYDVAGRLTSLTPWTASATTYTYRATGLLKTQTRANGTTTSYGYDSASRLTSLRHARGTTTIEQMTYVLDANGNRTQQTNGDGVTNYGYDALNRLVEASYPAIAGGPGASSVAYGYDAVGNRTTINGVPTYSYDASGRITNPGFSYDTNGNLLSDGTTAYTFDAANRLIQTVRGGTTTSYDYDGWGNLIRETVDGVAMDLLVDEAAPLPTVLGEVRADGTELRYAYGPDGVAAQQQRASGSAQPVAFPLLDGLGSVRRLTDSTGASVRTSSYDAFGSIRHQIGSATTTLGFTGERTGTADSLVYLRARHYAPELGRFLQRDTFAGFVDRPQSLNRYTYTENNPVTFTDPTGHWCDCGRGGGGRANDGSARKRAGHSLINEGRLRDQYHKGKAELANDIRRQVENGRPINEEFAREVVDKRNQLRQDIRNKGEPIIDLYNQVERGPADMPSYEYQRDVRGKTVKDMLESATRANAGADLLAEGFKKGGAVLLGADAGIAIGNVINAPEGQRGRVALQEAGGFSGALAGGLAGAKAGAVGLGTIGTAIAGPHGGLAGAAVGSVAGGGVGAILGDRYVRKAADRLANCFGL